MPGRLDVVCLKPAPELLPALAAEFPAGAISVITPSSGNTSLTEMNRTITAGSAGWVLLLAEDHPRSGDLIRRALPELNRTSTDLLLLAREPNLHSLALWSRLPPLIASLALPLTPDVAIFLRRSVWQKLQGLRDLPDARWDLLIRAGAAEHPIASGEPATNELPPPPANLPPLVAVEPGPDRRWLQQHLAQLRPQRCGVRLQSDADAVALKAGLFLLHDFIEDSHTLSQSVEHLGTHRNGDYWHGILHRREPDDANARYWFRQIGQHPLYPQLAARAVAIWPAQQDRDLGAWQQRICSTASWDPIAFIDFCSRCRSGQIGSADSESADDPSPNRLAARLQWLEMQLLLASTSQDAFAS